MKEQVLLPYYTFEYEGNIYILNINEMKFGKITEELMKVIKKVEENTELSSINHEFIEELNRLRLIKHKNYVPPSVENILRKFKNPVVATISLFITQTCNLRCIYCYGGRGEYGKKGVMDEITAFRSIDWIIEQSKEENNIFVSFFGGEPLLNFGLVKKVVSYCEKKEKEYKKKFEFYITTNGTLLSDDIISYCKKKNIGFLISFDGPKEIQDYNRPFKEGYSSSYDEALPKIKKLLSHIPETTVRATVCGDIDLQYVIDFLSEFGFGSYHFVQASMSPYNSLPEKEEKFSLTDKIIAYYRKEGGELLKAIKNRDKEKVKKLKLSRSALKFIMRETMKKYFYCEAGRCYVAISTSGDIYPCHRFVGLEKYKIGNIYSNDLLREECFKFLIFTSDKCIECWAKYFCGGGCIYNRIIDTGTILKPVEETCRIIKAFNEIAIYVSCELNECDISWLEDKEIIPRIKCYFDI